VLGGFWGILHWDEIKDRVDLTRMYQPAQNVIEERVDRSFELLAPTTLIDKSPRCAIFKR
jgi:hypothetical protein